MRDWRAGAALAALLCNFVLATIVLTPVHAHPHRYCEICVSGHLPALPELSPAALVAPSCSVLLILDEPESRVAEFHGGIRDPRGPPPRS